MLGQKSMRGPGANLINISDSEAYLFPSRVRRLELYRVTRHARRWRRDQDSKVTQHRSKLHRICRHAAVRYQDESRLWDLSSDLHLDGNDLPLVGSPAS